MRELNTELWKVGIPAKTQHNEAAPNQFEITPIFQSSSAAVDANQLIMETIKTVARRHDMEALLHEKPYTGVNGSGKHINWSLDTDDGINLFNPGENPGANARFLLFCTAVMEAVDRYALLIRSSAATSGNEHRLGASEAPPAIVSVFLGGPLKEIFDNIANGKNSGETKSGGFIKIGVTSLPPLPKDVSDRNRTSPFAFTGNKFEFRMAGSSQSIATPITYLNAAMAQVLMEYANRLESIPPRKASVINEVIQSIIKESYIKHRRVVFNGNGYSDDWFNEAEKRGLPNVKNTVDALSVLIDSETISLFKNHLILTKEEMESRYYIYLEKYSKQINIEAGVTLDLARRYIFPAATTQAARFAAESAALMNAGANNKHQIQQARKIAEITAGLHDDIAVLEDSLLKAQSIEEAPVRAKAYLEEVLPCMNTLRAKADSLEKIVSKESWPLPGYEELLFKL
jgi:glutamine synthetase